MTKRTTNHAAISESRNENDYYYHENAILNPIAAASLYLCRYALWAHRVTLTLYMHSHGRMFVHEGSICLIGGEAKAIATT